MTEQSAAAYEHVEVNGREYVSKDWHGLMAILDDIYPADVFTGSSGDPGPQIVNHLRQIDRLRRGVRKGGRVS